MKKIFSVLLTLVILVSFVGVALAGGQNIRTYSMSIYDTGSGTTIGQLGDNASVSSNSQYFTWRADGSKTATADNRTLDLNDTAPNWRAITFRTAISSVTSVAVSGNTYYVTIESCNELRDTNCNWSDSANATSGVSPQEIYPEVIGLDANPTVVTTWAGTSPYPRDITSLMSPAARYYRFRFMGGVSQYPGSPTGTSWANEVGPKAWLVITSY